jgi:broad specificity phosphatase PhoE
MRRPSRVLSLVALIGALLLGCRPAAPEREVAVEPITAYLLRHAEKVDESDESGLTAAGQARAQALAEQLGREPIVAVLASQFPRTQLTVDPLAGRLGLEVETLDAHDYDGFAARVRALAAGQALVVSGHSNTIPLIAERLGVASPPPESEVAYGDLYVVRLQGDSATFERRRYGDP